VFNGAYYALKGRHNIWRIWQIGTILSTISNKLLVMFWIVAGVVVSYLMYKQAQKDRERSRLLGSVPHPGGLRR